MARGNQTFKKRQRENKLREKAQQKRERREQRKIEKKQLPVGDQAATPAELQDAEVAEAPASELGGGGQ